MYKDNWFSFNLAPSMPLDALQASLREKLARLADSGVLICLMILAFALPFTAVTNIWRIGLWAGVILWLTRMVLDGKARLVRTPLDVPLALFAIACFLSLITAVDRSYSFGKILSDVVAQILVFYLAVNNLRTVPRARWVFGALLTGTLVMDLYGVIHYWSIGEKILDPVLRESSLHASVTELGTYLLQIAPFLTAGIFLYKNTWARLALAAFLVLHLLMAYMTLARMVVLVLILQMGVVLILAGKPWKLVVPMTLAVLVLTIAAFPRAIIVSNPNPEYHVKIGGKVAVDGLKSERFIIWERAWRHLKRNPFTGIGYGRESYGRAFPEIPEINTLFTHSHNTYLQMALSLGVQGLAVFLLIFCMVFYRLYKVVGRRGLNLGLPGLIVSGTLVSVMGFCLRNMTDDMYTGDAVLMLWLLIGCAFSMKRFILDQTAEVKA